MRSDVPANTIAENVFAEKTLQHSQERLPLFVSDIIESAVGFRLRRDGLLNRMRCRSCVAFHRLFLRDSDAPGGVARKISPQPDFPLRVEMRGAFRAHPRGEAFVEPEVVPPRHGHEITKPLVRHLVREIPMDISLRVRT